MNLPVSGMSKCAVGACECRSEPSVHVSVSHSVCGD